jgi:multidrug transporter EmrE-like cation transporter
MSVFRLCHGLSREIPMPMKLKLKEDPREWQQFTLVMVLAFSLLSYLLFRRSVLSESVLAAVWIGLGTVGMICSLRPRWFRRLYRAGMTASFYVGQAMGQVLLILVFLVVVTPLGYILRLSGKDLLKLKKEPQASTYWHPAKTSRHFDRLF